MTKTTTEELQLREIIASDLSTSWFIVKTSVSSEAFPEPPDVSKADDEVSFCAELYLSNTSKFSSAVRYFFSGWSFLFE